jgi:hypothetical protein
VRGDAEAHIELFPRGSGDHVAQQAKIIVLEPHLAEVVGHLECEGFRVHLDGTQRGEPEFENLGVEQGAEVFLGG